MSRTVTQTLTQTRTRAPSTLNFQLFPGDPGSPGDDSDPSSPGDNIDNEEILTPICDKIVNVYASIPILYKMRGSYTGQNGIKYHVVTSKQNINMYAIIQELLDPEEFRIYEPLLFLEQSKILIPYRKDKKTPTKGQEWLFVRCKNNILQIVHPSDLVNNIATARYKYRKAPEKIKQEINEKTHYVFEREKNEALQKIKKLDSCDNITSTECNEAFTSSCTNEVKEPYVLKAIYNLGKRVTGKADKTWEEVCNDTNPDVYTLNKPTRKISTRKSSQAGGKKKTK